MKILRDGVGGEGWACGAQRWRIEGQGCEGKSSAWMDHKAGSSVHPVPLLIPPPLPRASVAPTPISWAALTPLRLCIPLLLSFSLPRSYSLCMSSWLPYKASSSDSQWALLPSMLCSAVFPTPWRERVTYQHGQQEGIRKMTERRTGRNWKETKISQVWLQSAITERYISESVM